MPTRLALRTFGALVVTDRQGQTIPVSAAQSRLLAALALAFPDAVTEDRLVDVLWPAGEPPRTARQSLHNHISRLRQRTDRDAIVRGASGYCLHPESDVDLRRFEAWVSAVRASTSDDDVRDLATVEDLLSMAREPPVPELGDDEVAAACRRAVDQSVTELQDRRAELLISVGQIDRALVELKELTTADPGRERRWELLLVALQRAGRVAEALQTFHRARRKLIDTFGIEPGPQLRSLHHRLLEATEPARDSPSPGPTFGRERDLEQVGHLLEQGKVVQVTGPAGIGKTTFLAAAARSWQAGPVFRVACAENPWAALTPVEDLLRRLAAASPERDVPRRLADLHDPVDREALGRLREPEGVTVRATRAITQALAALDHPLLLVDDIDRAGPSTQDVLLTVAADPAVACLLTGRFEHAPAMDLPDHEAFPLSGLEPDALTALAAHAGHARAEAGAVGRWLHEHTSGHPLYALELLASLGEERPWVPGERDDGLSLSPSLLALVHARLGGVPPGCRPLLDAAAVGGDPVEVSLLRGVADIGQLDGLIASGVLVREQGRLRFAHSLLAKVAYDLVPSGRRKELHHAVGLRCYDPAVRAQHLARTAELDPDAAVAALVAAGRASLVAEAYADASAWFTQAADIAETHGWGRAAVLDLQLEARDCDRLDGRPGHAEPLLDIAEEALRLGHADLRRRATVSAVQLGEAVDAGPLQERAAAVADAAIAVETDAKWRGRILATASILHSISGEPDRCRDMFLEAMAGLDPGDDHAACEVLPYAYMALGHPDDLPAREAAATDLHRAARRTGDRAAEWEANHLRCSVAMFRGDGAALRTAFDECERLLADAGAAGRRWSNRYLAAAIAAIDERYDDAEALTEDVLATGSGVAPARAMSTASGHLLGIRWQQGRLGELADPLEFLIGEQPEIPAWKAAGSLVLAERDPARAAQLFDDVVVDGGVTLPRDFTWLAGVLCLGGAAVRLADPERARRVLPHLAPYTHLTCWQGTCTYGPVATIAADVAVLTGDPRETGWRETSRALLADLRR
ncbi:AAA family ATPase [Acidimicrobiia bacterium EGI L10123]|uniref:BTAD domain-containing putative transcriptional regulator n=1 Tax=Salinilacustrithrix flava TaxID=2957203 RepID=UPI003D7C22F8|nr:AAA family ATPase [Acidimicrobiia bacterium EGI L10123]